MYRTGRVNQQTLADAIMLRAVGETVANIVAGATALRSTTHAYSASYTPDEIGEPAFPGYAPQYSQAIGRLSFERVTTGFAFETHTVEEPAHDREETPQSEELTLAQRLRREQERRSHGQEETPQSEKQFDNDRLIKEISKILGDQAHRYKTGT